MHPKLEAIIDKSNHIRQTTPVEIPATMILCMTLVAPFGHQAALKAGRLIPAAISGIGSTLQNAEKEGRSVGYITTFLGKSGDIIAKQNEVWNLSWSNPYQVTNYQNFGKELENKMVSSIGIFD